MSEQQTMTRLTPARLAGAALLAAAMGCNSTELTHQGGDRIVPTASVSIGAGATNDSTGADSVNVRQGVTFTIDASDDAGLSSVVWRVLVGGAQFQVDSAAPASLGATFHRTVNLPLPGVLPGQKVSVALTVLDRGGNTGAASAAAVAFDPNVPRVRLSNADAAVIPGGTYNVTVRGDDSLGVLKLGYGVTGLPGAARADSVVRSVPLPKADSASFQIQIPAGVTVGSTFSVEPFAENRDGLRSKGEATSVRVVAAGPDVQSPLLYQAVPARMERGDTLTFTARDPDGLLSEVGFILKDSTGHEVYRSADKLSTQVQQVTRRKSFLPPLELRGRGLFVVGYAIDAAGHTGYAVPAGATLPITADSLAKRDPTVFAFGHTTALPVGSLGADIAVDTARSTVYVSNLNRNQLEAFRYGSSVVTLPSVSVGSMPWGMTIDRSESFLLVANSGGTNISRVDLRQRSEVGRVKTTNEYVYDIQYSKDDASGGFKFKLTGPIDYSDRPQYIAQSASGAIYYSTLPTTEATPGTLRRIDDFLATRPEPKQIWQYGSLLRGHWVVLNADAIDVREGKSGVADSLIICDHPQGQPVATQQCFQDIDVMPIITALRGLGANVVAVKDLDVASLALPDTNFVAVGGDRRRVAFGEAHTGNRAGRVLLVTDTLDTPAFLEEYSAPIEVKDLTNNASDRVFGVAINGNSSNIAVHGVETFFADSALRLQGKYATFNTGAGIAFHPLNDSESPADLTTRVVFVASGDRSIQIVDSYTYRMRGRIPLRTNLYGPLRAALPTPAEQASDPTLVVKLFGLTPEGLVVVDVRTSDIDNGGAVGASRARR
jgi:hypothetical protein